MLRYKKKTTTARIIKKTQHFGLFLSDFNSEFFTFSQLKSGETPAEAKLVHNTDPDLITAFTA